MQNNSLFLSSIQCLCLEASLKILESEIRGGLKDFADVSKQIWGDRLFPLSLLLWIPKSLLKLHECLYRYWMHININYQIPTQFGCALNLSTTQIYLSPTSNVQLLGKTISGNILKHNRIHHLRPSLGLTYQFNVESYFSNFRIWQTITLWSLRTRKRKWRKKRLAFCFSAPSFAVLTNQAVSMTRITLRHESELI